MAFELVVEEWLKRDQSKNKASSLYQVTHSVEGDLLPAWRGKRVDEIGKRDVIELLDLSLTAGPSSWLGAFSHTSAASSAGASSGTF